MAKIYGLRSGAKIPEDVLAVSVREKVATALFTGIGGVKNASLAYFNRETKQYEEHKFSEELEATSLIGNITIKDRKPSLHVHGTFGRRDMSVIGGHVISATVSPLLEFVLTPARNRAVRQFDDGAITRSIASVASKSGAQPNAFRTSGPSRNSVSSRLQSCCNSFSYKQCVEPLSSGKGQVEYGYEPWRGPGDALDGVDHHRNGG